jgi:hypothetical protein
VLNTKSKIPLSISIYGLNYKLFEDLCKDVISLDPSLRFAGIADEDGRLLASSFREGLKPLLTSEERAQYAITAATRQFTRLRWEYLLGKIVYACSHYAKLIRATIPITDNTNRLSYVLLISLDKRTSNFHEIIMKKVVPLVSRNTSMLLKEAHT